MMSARGFADASISAPTGEAALGYFRLLFRSYSTSTAPTPVSQRSFEISA